MATITYSDFQSVMNLTISDISAINTEKILDLAIDCLNLYGNLELSNLQGTAGSKTVSVESKQKAAIYLVARAVYYSFFKGLTSAAIQGLNVSSPDLLSDPTVLESIREAAGNLQETEWARAFYH